MARHPDQFMIYHFTEWDTEKQKWKKKPVGLDGSALAAGGGIPTSNDRAQVAAAVSLLGDRYRVGLWLHPDSQFFFLDLDDNAVSNGQLTPLANSMAAALVAAGCYFEASSSGRGAHVIGRLCQQLPSHATSRKSVHPHEFFTRDRGVVLNADAHAGSWDVEPPAALVLRLVTEYFPPRTADDMRQDTTQRRAEWRGPEDDGVLILRMLGASGSAAARLRGSNTLSQLWNGDCPHTSESDFALASHLAFWTGCDVPRIERLMRQSPLARHRLDKWDTHRTYLRELSITEACATTTTVYAEPQRVDTAAALLGTSRTVSVMPIMPPSRSATAVSDAVILGEPATSTVSDWFDYIESASLRINSAGSLRELYDVIVPSIAAVSMPPIHGESIVGVMSRKLDSFGSKQPLHRLRALLMPAPLADALITQTVPDWAQSIVYVRSSDGFFDTVTGGKFNQTGLRMTFNREMPMKSTGVREDPVQRLMDSWNIVNVDDIQYRPGQPPVFEHAGRLVANEFRASTMPTPVHGSAECGECVQLFMHHLAQITNQRPAIYAALLGWLAHNIQFPGVKIRWAPLIKGVGGDGKSIIGDLMFAALGEANVKITSPSTISSSGGFTDWAMGACVNIIEEIRLEGKERRQLYNSMKTILGDHRINPNRKGKASTETHVNVMNHMAFTNYEDSQPLDNDDRRWGIIFTPWGSADEAAQVKGLASAADLPAFFKRLGGSMRSEPGAWRSWMMGIDLSSFNPDGRAPWTEERDTMVSSSEDYTEQTIRDCITRGGSGVDIQAFSSPLLMHKVQIALGQQPDTRSWNRILTDLGYRQHTNQIWWTGRSHRVWTKKSLTKDEILEILTKSAFAVDPLR